MIGTPRKVQAATNAGTSDQYTARPMATRSPDSATAGRAGPAVDGRAVERAMRRLAFAPSAPWLHEEVARRMAERLQVIRTEPSRILRWSGWLGGGESLLTSRYPKASVQVAEPSPALRERSLAARSRPAWRPWKRAAREPAVVLEGDVPEASIDLLWANMALHGSADPPALLQRWQRLLSVGGFVMFSSFGPETLKELRELYRQRGWPEPVQSFVDMHDLGDMMVAAGFADPVMDQETVRLNWADANALLAELRSIGANASPSRFAGLRTPRWRAALEEAISAAAGDRRPSLSFEIVYGHAFKAAPRAPVSGETSIPIEHVRDMMRARRGSDSG